jgi:hypothetical protein
VVLAEKTLQLFDGSAYGDLLAFERDLASLSSLTVVFVESAGSIAELGSFSVLPEIHRKLLVVIEHGYANKPSFIWLGPARYLKNQGAHRVQVFPWLTGDSVDAGLAEDCVGELVEHVEGIVNADPKTMAFQADDIGHKMLLIADMLRVMQLCQKTEIASVLARMSVAVTDQQLDNYISLLWKFELIQKFDYGHNEYYGYANSEMALDLAFKGGAKFNKIDRWKAEFRREMQVSDPRRFKALSAFVRRLGFEEIGST